MKDLTQFKTQETEVVPGTLSLSQTRSDEMRETWAPESNSKVANLSLTLHSNKVLNLLGTPLVRLTTEEVTTSSSESL